MHVPCALWSRLAVRCLHFKDLFLRHFWDIKPIQICGFSPTLPRILTHPFCLSLKGRGGIANSSDFISGQWIVPAWGPQSSVNCAHTSESSKTLGFCVWCLAQSLLCCHNTVYISQFWSLEVQGQGASIWSGKDLLGASLQGQRQEGMGGLKPPLKALIPLRRAQTAGLSMS